MGLKIKSIRKIRTLSLSRPTQPVLTEEERIQKLKGVISRMETRLAAKTKAQRQTAS